MQRFDKVVISAPYNMMTAAQRRDIAILQERAYGPSGPEQDDDSPALHDQSLNAQSFIIRDGERVVSYAGVVKKTIVHAGQVFSVSGLSCVATDPDFQRCGLGTRIVAAATRYMEETDIDFGIFTCAPELAPLYVEAGLWSVVPTVVLIGSRDAGALTSTSLGVVVLMRLFSERAIAASSTLLNGTIDLDLPPGEFW